MVVDLFVHILCIRTFICESNDLAHQSTQKIMIASQKYSDRWREHNKHNTQKKRGSQLFDTRRLNAIKQQQKSFHPYAIRIFKKKMDFFFLLCRSIELIWNVNINGTFNTKISNESYCFVFTSPTQKLCIYCQNDSKKNHHQCAY